MNKNISSDFTLSLAKPFTPLDTDKLDQKLSRSDVALMRIAHAAEYIAGQSFLITRHLEDSPVTAQLTDLVTAVDTFKGIIDGGKF